MSESRFSFISIHKRALSGHSIQENSASNQIIRLIKEGRYAKTPIVAETLNAATQELSNQFIPAEYINIPIKYVTGTKDVKYTAFYLNDKEYALSPPITVVSMGHQREQYGFITVKNTVIYERMISKRILTKLIESEDYTWQDPVVTTREACLGELAKLQNKPNCITVPVKYIVEENKYFLLSYMDKDNEVSLGKIRISTPFEQKPVLISSSSPVVDEEEKPSAAQPVEAAKATPPVSQSKKTFEFSDSSFFSNRNFNLKNFNDNPEEDVKKLVFVTPNQTSNN